MSDLLSAIDGVRSAAARRVDELATIVKALESKSQALDSLFVSLSRRVDALAVRPAPFCMSREVDDRSVSVHEKLMTDLRADVDMLLAPDAPAAAHPSLVGEATPSARTAASVSGCLLLPFSRGVAGPMRGQRRRTSAKSPVGTMSACLRSPRLHHFMPPVM